MQAIWKKKEKLSPLGNEASLNFVSLRSHFNSVGRRGLSRVEMNALRAPLTALYVSAEMEIFFSLDTADAFIDADFAVLACEQGRQRQHLVCRRKSEQHLSKDQVEGSRFKCSLPHEQRTSNTGTNVRPYGVSE